MGKYDAAAATALGLISSKGTPLTLYRRSASSFDPVTQQETETEDAYIFQAVCMPPGKSAEYEVGSLVGKKAVRIIFALKGAAFEPQPGDAVTYKGKRWTIFWVKTTDPAGDGAVMTVAYAEI